MERKVMMRKRIYTVKHVKLVVILIHMRKCDLDFHKDLWICTVNYEKL
jgi:hypothetical protein